MTLSIEQLKKAFPDARMSNLQKYVSHLNDGMDRFEINTPTRITFFIAQLAHESGNFRFVEELASGKDYEYRKDLGNLKKAALAAAHAKGTTTGRFYKGRGLIQLTGYNNYKACGSELSIDLVNNPELLIEPKYAALSACWFWHSNGLNELSDIGDFKAVTRRINGGYSGLADRQLKLASISGVMNA